MTDLPLSLKNLFRFGRKKSFESCPSLSSAPQRNLTACPCCGMNVCVLKTLTVQPCVLSIFLKERRSQFATHFPSSARTASCPLVGDLRLQALEWMEEMVIWFLLAVPKSRYTILTSHFLSLVFSDHHLITVWQVRYVVGCLHGKPRVWQAVFF